MPLYDYSRPGNLGNNLRGSSGNQSLDNRTGSNSTDISLSRMSNDERKAVINEVFLLVYGQEATPRDISYYRYSALTKNQLILKLIKSDKHKDLVQKGAKYDELLNNKNALELKLRFLQNQIESVQQEFITLKQLLEEKNRHIHQLREHINIMAGVSNQGSSDNSGLKVTNPNNNLVEDPTEKVPTYVPLSNKNYYQPQPTSEDSIPTNSANNINNKENKETNGINGSLSNDNRDHASSNSSDNRGIIKRFIDYLISRLI